MSDKKKAEPLDLDEIQEQIEQAESLKEFIHLAVTVLPDVMKELRKYRNTQPLTQR